MGIDIIFCIFGAPKLFCAKNVQKVGPNLHTWNPLTKCNHILKEKVKKITNWTILFFSVFNFFYFFLQNLIAFGERIPKRYNTWVLTSYFADLEHLNYFVRKMCKKLTKICIHDLNTQVLYLFGILSPNAIRFWRKK